MRRLIAVLLMFLVSCSISFGKADVINKYMLGPTIALRYKRNSPPSFPGVIINPSHYFYQGQRWSGASGVVFKSRGIHFVLTAAHVVRAYQRSARSDDLTGYELVRHANIYPSSGSTWRVNEQRPTKWAVIRSSEKQDLALLKLRVGEWAGGAARPLPMNRSLEIGQTIYQASCFLSEIPWVTQGIVGGWSADSMENEQCIQVSAACVPGSSGGGIYTEDGYYCGMVVEGRGRGDACSLAVPVGRIRHWLHQIRCSWVWEV